MHRKLCDSVHHNDLIRSQKSKLGYSFKIQLDLTIRPICLGRSLVAYTLHYLSTIEVSSVELVCGEVKSYANIDYTGTYRLATVYYHRRYSSIVWCINFYRYLRLSSIDYYINIRPMWNNFVGVYWQPWRGLFRGLCTGWAAQINNGDVLPASSTQCDIR